MILSLHNFRSAVGADFAGLEGRQRFAHVGVDVEDGIEVGEIQQPAHEGAGAGTFEVSLSGLCPGMQESQFANASAVDGADAPEIENYFASILKNLPDHTPQVSGLVAVDDAAVAVNDDYIAAISSFQTQFQRRLLK